MFKNKIYNFVIISLFPIFLLTLANIDPYLKIDHELEKYQQLFNLGGVLLIILLISTYFILFVMSIIEILKSISIFIFKKYNLLSVIVSIENIVNITSQFLRLEKLKSARAIFSLVAIYFVLFTLFVHFYIEKSGILIPTVFIMSLVIFFVFYFLPIAATLLLILLHALKLVITGEREKIKPMLRKELYIIFLLKQKKEGGLKF